jgi:hypothetical protein
VAQEKPAIHVSNTGGNKQREPTIAVAGALRKSAILWSAERERET